jgi:hypothetical protein
MRKQYMPGAGVALQRCPILCMDGAQFIRYIRFIIGPEN